MVFRRPKFISWFSLTAVLLLAFGLGATVLSTQQSHDDRSKADYARPGVPSVIRSEKSSQTSLGPCYADSGERAGALCKSDGGTQNGSVTAANAHNICPGGFIGGDARNGSTASNTWYCPNGNDYRCCFDAAPVLDAATVNGQASASINPSDTVTLSATGHDPDSTSPKTNQYGSDEFYRSTVGFFWEQTDSNPKVTLSKTGEILNTPGETTATGFQADKTYKFRVRAFDGYKYSNYSNDLTVTVQTGNKAPTVSAGSDKTVALPATSTSLTGTATDPDGDTMTYQWTKVSGPAGGNIQSPTSLTTNITNLQEGVYVFKLTVTDAKGGKTEATVKITVTASPTTTLKLKLLLHGIGKAGDNANPGEAGGGTKPPILKTLQRYVTVQVVSADNQIRTINDVLVTYDTQTGSFIGDATFTNNAPGFENFENGVYAVYVKFSQSLNTLVPPGFIVITRGSVNTIPQFSLVTGDINHEETSYNKLNIQDYNSLLECYSDFEAADPSCTPEKKALADINDDGDVNILDLNLFLRELSVQGGVGN